MEDTFSPEFKLLGVSSIEHGLRPLRALSILGQDQPFQQLSFTFNLTFMNGFLSFIALNRIHVRHVLLIHQAAWEWLLPEQLVEGAGSQDGGRPVFQLIRRGLIQVLLCPRRQVAEL